LSAGETGVDKMTACGMSPTMKHASMLGLFLALVLATTAAGAEKPDTVLIHPGEVAYAEFEQAGNSLKLVGTSKEKNEKAQLIMTMHPFDGRMLILGVQSRFLQTMSYKAEMRIPNKNRRLETSVIPIPAGLVGFESWPHPIEELALYGFELIP